MQAFLQHHPAAQIHTNIHKHTQTHRVFLFLFKMADVWQNNKHESTYTHINSDRQYDNYLAVQLKLAICIAHIHKSQFASSGFNKVRHPLFLNLNKNKEKRPKTTILTLEKECWKPQRATCEGSHSRDRQKCNRCNCVTENISKITVFTTLIWINSFCLTRRKWDIKWKNHRNKDAGCIFTCCHLEFH